MGLLEQLAQIESPEDIPAHLPSLQAVLRRQAAMLRARQVPVNELLVSQRLSRELSLYRSPSPAARAAAQLEQTGKHLRPGQSVRFLFTLGEPGVWAWDRPEPFNPATLDIRRYITLLLRAAETILQPFGLAEQALRLEPGEQLPFVILPSARLTPRHSA
jgi:DNA polymerase elongation subunit (family B)